MRHLSSINCTKHTIVSLSFKFFSRKRNVTVFLILAVIAIWGWVIRLVVLQVGSSGEMELVQKSDDMVSEPPDIAHVSLLLAYQDPFNENRLTKKPPLRPKFENTPTRVQVESTPAPDVIYLGSVTGASDKRIALVKFGGKFYHAGIKDVIGSMYVNIIYLDSIELKDGKRRFVIEKRQKK